VTRLAQSARCRHQFAGQRILERACIVHHVHSGRESLFEFDPEAMERAREYLNFVSAQWDQAFDPLKAFVED
jgi:hypothetical protein